jgi:AraC-like DNA-binding protein
MARILATSSSLRVKVCNPHLGDKEASAPAQHFMVQCHQNGEMMMDNHSAGMVAVCVEAPEFMDDMCGSIAHHPAAVGDACPHHDRWRALDTILDMVGGQAPDRQMDRHPETAAIGVLSRANPPVANSCSQENLVAALSLAVNEALLGSPRRLERFLPSDPTVRQLLEARGAANEMAREPARLYLRLLYSAILTWVAARGTIKWSDRQRALAALPTWRFERVRAYIHSHIEDPIRLRDLAKVAGLSRMHFAAQFRAYTGISPGKFVMRQRIQLARGLLGDPRRTLVDVALSVGFRNQTHFTTVFHRVVGMTPGRWRKALPRETILVSQSRR